MKVLNFGSLNLDLVYNVPHFVRPGETLQAKNYKTFFGGKGLNQSVALARAGAKVAHAGCIGPEGRALRDCLESEGVDVSRIKTVETPSGHAVIQVNSEGQNCILIFAGANRCVDASTIDKAFSGFGRNDFLLIQNEISALPEIIGKALDLGMRIIFNPAPMDDSVCKLPIGRMFALLVNETEAAALGKQQDPIKAAEAIAERHPELRLVLTLGEKGVCYFCGSEKLEMPAYKVKAVDTTAAGDVFTGYFTAALMRSIDCSKPDLRQALREASAAAAISVTRPGAYASVPFKKEVAEFILSAGPT